MKPRNIVCDGKRRKTMVGCTIIIYIEVNLGQIKTNDTCWKKKVTGTKHRGFTVMIKYICYRLYFFGYLIKNNLPIKFSAIRNLLLNYYTFTQVKLFIWIKKRKMKILVGIFERVNIKIVNQVTGNMEKNF